MTAPHNLALAATNPGPKPRFDDQGRLDLGRLRPTTDISASAITVTEKNNPWEPVRCQRLCDRRCANRAGKRRNGRSPADLGIAGPARVRSGCLRINLHVAVLHKHGNRAELRREMPVRSHRR